MKASLFHLTLLAATTLLAADQPPAAVRISEAMHHETIAHLQLKEATLQEALAAVRGYWDKAHPDDPLPVGLTDYSPPDGIRESYQPRITVDLKNIPYIDALRFVGTLAGRNMVVRRGGVQMEELAWIQEDWVTKAHPVNEKSLTALGLTPTSSSDEVRSALEKLGVEFGPWMKAALTTHADAIVVTNLEAQQSQISGILHLLHKGFKISK